MKKTNKLYIQGLEMTNDLLAQEGINLKASLRTSTTRNFKLVDERNLAESKLINKDEALDEYSRHVAKLDRKAAETSSYIVKLETNESKYSERIDTQRKSIVTLHTQQDNQMLRISALEAEVEVLNNLCSRKLRQLNDIEAVLNGRLKS